MIPGTLTPPLVPRGTCLKDVMSQGSPLQRKTARFYKQIRETYHGTDSITILSGGRYSYKYAIFVEAPLLYKI
jgi:hypothetical protein